MNPAPKEAVVLPPSTVPTSSPLALPPRLFVPLPATLTSSGLPAGTHVARGQPLISDAAATKECIPLAPASGRIVALCEVQLLDGNLASALEIDVDPPGETGVDELPAEASSTPTATMQANLASLTDQLRNNGVYAVRNTSPDLIAQLQAAPDAKVDAVVCNLLDVDGGSSLHAKVVREHGALIVSGVRIVAQALGVSKAIIAAAPSLAGRASVLVRKASAGAKIKVETLENDYPLPDPTLLLYALFGRRLRPGALPTTVNAIVLDGVAAAAVGRCIERSEAMLTVPIEIRDSIRARTHVAVAAVGTPLRFVLESMGLRDVLTLRAGAALRDVRVTPDAIVSGNGELSIDAGAPSKLINPDPCIRSGWCVENCPVRINPAALLEAAQDNDSAMAEAYGLHACIECGICSYVCPSRLPLLPSIRALRKKLA